MNNEKSSAEILKEKLFYTKKHIAEILSDKEIETAFDFCEEYKNFLDYARTERRAVNYAVNKAKELGYREFDKNKKYAQGDKVL